MIKGVLLAESLRLDVPLGGRGLLLRSIRRSDVSSTTDAQPDTWTFVEFEAPSGIADTLAAALASALLPDGGWYADFSVDDEHVVVFADRVFRYRRGDIAGRAA